MKAWVLHEINDIRFDEVPEPVPARREVLVQVKAVGICGSDIPRIFQTGAHVHPLIPGHEFAGIVTETGADVPKTWRGRRVGIFPLIPCGNCLPCQREQYEMCRNYSYLGSRRNGGFAEYVTVPVENLIELPPEVSYEAAAMMEPMAVAVHALRRIRPIQTDTVAVCGLGTIGLLLVMFLKEMGIRRLLVIGNKDFQKETVRQLGVPESDCYDTRDGDVGKWLMERTKKMGPDVFFECVGKKETISLAVDSAAPAGHICLMGNPYTDLTLDKMVYWKILRNQLHIMGTWNSSFRGVKDKDSTEEDDWHYVLRRIRQGRINPAQLITHRYPLEKLGQGFEIMRNKSEDYVKVMAVW